MYLEYRWSFIIPNSKEHSLLSNSNKSPHTDPNMNLTNFIWFSHLIHTLPPTHTVSSSKTRHDSGAHRVRPSHTRSLGVQHLNEQVVAGHLSTQMHVAQVVLGLRAEGPQLRQPHHQLAELLLELWVAGQGVLQQSPVHLLLDTLHECLVLQQLHICTHTGGGRTGIKECHQP